MVIFNSYVKLPEGKCDRSNEPDPIGLGIQLGQVLDAAAAELGSEKTLFLP